MARMSSHLHCMLNSGCFDIALFVRSLRLVLLLHKQLAIKVVCIQDRLTVIVLERQQLRLCTATTATQEQMHFAPGKN